MPPRATSEETIISNISGPWCSPPPKCASGAAKTGSSQRVNGLGPNQEAGVPIHPPSSDSTASTASAKNMLGGAS